MYQRIIPLMSPHSSVLFSDDFNDNSIDPLKWTKTDGADITCTETSQQIHFTAAPVYHGVVGVSTLNSVPLLNFTGKKFTVDIVSTTGLGQQNSGSGGTTIQLVDSANGNNYAFIYTDFGGYGFGINNNGVASQDTSHTFSPSDTKWRIEHDSVNNKMKFWTLTSGIWTLRFTSAALTWNPTSVKLTLAAYIYGFSETNKVSIFDNVIVDPAP